MLKRSSKSKSGQYPVAFKLKAIKRGFGDSALNSPLRATRIECAVTPNHFHGNFGDSALNSPPLRQRELNALSPKFKRELNALSPKFQELNALSPKFLTVTEIPRTRHRPAWPGYRRSI